MNNVIQTSAPLRVLMITSEWPTPEHPDRASFIVQQVNYLRRAGLDVVVFSFCGLRSPLNYWHAWRTMRRQHPLEHFDILHAQFGQSGLLGLPSPIPLVVTFHGSDLQGIVGRQHRYTVSGTVLQHVSRLVARQAREVIVVSPHLTRYLPAHTSAHVIPCGIDLERFQPRSLVEARRQLGLPEDRRLVLFAADPKRPVQRFALAQEAVALLPNQLGASIVTLSGVPHTEVPMYMNACDALVLTSHHEGSPTVVKEALACNLPVVSVDVGDVHERLHDVPGCIVCADDHAETIAAGLECVLTQGQRIDGRKAVQSLDESLVVQKIVDVYKRAKVYAGR